MDSLYKTVCLLLAIGNALHTNTLVVGQYVQMSDHLRTIPFSLKSRPFSFPVAFLHPSQPGYVMVVQLNFLLSSNVSSFDQQQPIFAMQLCNVDCLDIVLYCD